HYRALPPPTNEVPVAAYVGRMIKAKGIELLMQAYDLLLAEGLRLELHLFGGTDPGNRDAISAECLNEWCAERRARWHGHVSNIVEVWRTADFLVLPSRGEGMSRALLEAAACARPLLVTDVPGNRHFVRDGVEGLVVPAGDARALANGLARLASDRALRVAMGEAARRRLLSGYTESHVKATYRASYAELISPKV